MKYINDIDITSIRDSFNDKSKPFRYTVIDNFLKSEGADNFAKAYPSQTDSSWYRFRDIIHGEKNVFEQGMMGISDVETLPDTCLNVINELNSDEFIETLKSISGLNKLVQDTHNEIGQWAGIRAMLPNGYQSIHSDARKHPHLGMEKRITIVGYLNQEWGESDGGYTEIWNNDMTQCVDRVAPLYNRILLFENTETSYHGVPEVSNYRKSYLTSYLLDNDKFKENRPKARFVKRPNETDVEVWDKLSKIRENLKDY